MDQVRWDGRDAVTRVDREIGAAWPLSVRVLPYRALTHFPFGARLSLAQEPKKIIR